MVKMMKWSARPPAPASSKKFQVKVKPIKLRGIYRYDSIEDEQMAKVVMVEMVWKGPKLGLPPALRRSPKRNFSTTRIVQNGCEVVWEDDEFERMCSFSGLHKDGSIIPWDVSFNLLYGLDGESKHKYAFIGTVSMNLAELVLETKVQVERKLPVDLRMGGVSCEGTLSISVSFIEIRAYSAESVDDANEQREKEESFLRKVRHLTRHGSKKKKKKIHIEEGEEPSDARVSNYSTGNTDESSATFGSEGSPEDFSVVSVYYRQSKEPSGISRNRLETVPKLGFWRKKRLPFRSSHKKKDVLLIKGGPPNVDLESLLSPPYTPVSSNTESNELLVGSSSSEHGAEHKELSVGSWEEKDLISRDGCSKLKAKTFFASIDQRSDEASGVSACTVLVTVIADWLQYNENQMPSRDQFDSLIIEGSSKWRKLCENETYIQHFPDKHFDLETVLEANLKPLYITSHLSYIGFFCPERFESLKGAMSFDEIWNHIKDNAEEGESHIYIVSWNDHFFVMKIDNGAYYIIDTLGERLFEGCNRAYILKFDDTSEIHKLPEKNVSSTKEMNGVETKGKDGNCSDNKDKDEGEECEEMVCKGKECCLEFFKRFLAAIALREVEMEQKKGNIDSISFHQRLQIEFHFTSSSHSFTSSSSSAASYHSSWSTMVNM